MYKFFVGTELHATELWTRNGLGIRHECVMHAGDIMNILKCKLNTKFSDVSGMCVVILKLLHLIVSWHF